MTQQSTDKLWVGVVDGRALVYDPAMQIQDSAHLYLWNPTVNKMEQYVRSILKPQIKSHPDAAACGHLTEQYRSWHLSLGSAWLVAETERLREMVRREAKRMARAAKEAADREEEIIERHRKTMERLGLPPTTVQRAVERDAKQRTSHCYKCKEFLDGSLDLQCTACAWILCECGACGCGYSSAYKDSGRRRAEY